MKQKRARLIYNPTSGQEIMKKMLPRSWIFWKALALKHQPFKQHQMRTQQKMRPLVRPKQALT